MIQSALRTASVREAAEFHGCTAHARGAVTFEGAYNAGDCRPRACEAPGRREDVSGHEGGVMHQCTGGMAWWTRSSVEDILLWSRYWITSGYRCVLLHSQRSCI